MIVYFTGTGNSRYCAEYLGEQLGDEVLDAFSYIQNGIAADLVSGRPWVFVSPTYAWRIPRIFRDFIRSGCFHGAEDAYFVMSCGSDVGNAEKDLMALCRDCGLRYRGLLEVQMPENYLAMFPVPEEETARRIVRAAARPLEKGLRRIREQADFPPVKKQAFAALKSGPVNPLFYRFFVKAEKFYAKESCSGCGSCQALCPLNNIRIREGRPVWGKNCTHCMACICGCPMEAIEYGRISRGKPRYQCIAYKKN